ncbi:MAG: hypothetical protein ABMB14_05705 [Myxococcota bacterium]
MDADPIADLAAFATTTTSPSLEPTDQDAFADPVFGRALRSVRDATPDARSAAIARLVPALDAPDAYQAARVALICGTIVEWGADPAIAGPAVLARLHRTLARSPSGAGDPRGQRAVRFLGLAAMAMLTRDVGLRRSARGMSGFAEALIADPSAEASFVHQVLGLVDDLELTVLHPDRREGVRVSLEAVATVFHLLTLVQDLRPDWCGDDPPDPEVTAIARGDVPYTHPVTDHARFHLSDHTGLEPNLGATLWGEMSPAEIPAIHGERVVLVGKVPFGSRSWDGGFFANFHDALRSRLRVLDVLDRDVVNAKLRALRDPPG